MRNGFSLLELSIVLVIIGLLAGGVMTGQSLIRAAELRAVITEYQRYVTAMQAFRDKYMALPGDMKTATAFWGDDNTNCADAAVANGTPGTCNGDGNGNVDYNTAVSSTSETYQLWKQLALAGLLEGNFTGLSGPTLTGGYALNTIIGTNIPASKLSNAGS